MSIYVGQIESGMAICPFNSSHKVSQSRLQFHMVRCMKNYPNHVACPYNALHRYLRSELPNHLLVCPDKEVKRQQEQLKIRDYRPEENTVLKYINTEDEDWSINA